MIYLRGGVHRLQRPLPITDAAGAVTIRACPGEKPIIEGPEGAPAIVLKGSRAVALTGLTFVGPSSLSVLLDHARECVVSGNVFVGVREAVLLDHSSANQIVGNVIADVALAGIELKDGSDANLVADNVIDGVSAPETFGGGIFLHSTRDNRITRNSIQNTAGFGIGVLNWDDASINVDTVVEYNLLRRTALTALDSGAIYILGRSGIDTGVVIASNVIDGVGTPANHNVGIYLDDSTNGATVVRNIVRAVGSDAVQIHGGQDNRIENNLLDLGAGRPSAVLFQAAPADTHPLNRQTGNVVTHNVIVSSNPEARPYAWYDGGTPLVEENFYVLPGGAAPVQDQAVSDRRPVIAGEYLIGSDYSAIQEAADRAIGFRPIDPSAAGAGR